MQESGNAAPAGAQSRPPARDIGQAIRRGAFGRCPACGEGRLLHRYLKVHESCPACGEELHHHRADDFPAYLTIFVVGHILGVALFAVDDFWPDLPTWFHYVTWPTLVVLLCLWLLPILKGGLIGFQWALRMHGFETAHGSAAPSAEPSPDRAAQRSAA